jgi:purine-binding chemotaxis protein CheW
MKQIYGSNGEPLEILGEDFLVFGLGGRTYGMDYSLVEEIRHFDPEAIGEIEGAPDFVRGMGYVSGNQVPLVDLSAKLGLGGVRPTPRAGMIFTMIHERRIGLVVESLDGVTIQQPDCIDQAPQSDPVLPASVLLGLGQVGGRSVVLVDMTKLVTREEAEQAWLSAAVS